MAPERQQEPATTRLDQDATEVGSVFVSNYPPYSAWSEGDVDRVHEALNAPPRGTDLGLYFHIPFCRRRCKFCYFRVFTDKNAEQIERYLSALSREVERYAELPALRDRPVRFVYFGGGTPSYIAVKQLLPLVDRIRGAFPIDDAEEFAFECEPGTLTQSKLEAIRSIGVTRLSLGIENFDDAILEANGRAHLSNEISRVRPWIEELDFPQLNVDLIAGMVGETWESWRETVEKTIEYDPDSVTIYQMELPFNTIYSKGKLRGEDGAEFADWASKRAWHAYAMERLEAVGFERWSAYTALRADRGCKFVYTDALWQGADMIGSGVSSFSHLSGVHFQNADRWTDYLDRIEADELAVYRAFATSDDDRFIREFILQLKRGRTKRSYFLDRYGADPAARFSSQLAELESDGLLTVRADDLELSEAGLLRVDQLLPAFYDERYRGARYT